jgi:hypothetical protein
MDAKKTISEQFRVSFKNHVLVFCDVYHWKQTEKTLDQL